ncbi:MAG: putative lipid II flippase FtsW [Candidatus Niyogibacteria bacterium CG10_big_fil_rev_8_21_14_0_10_46_36]|uniref:Probable peptidoglycan glycosyltransferase FtsW n=1 Tax=Candidatus Niyogibacteria bacterium CG10_big_fil_rev_8_21_14_0_10_46_36 TaxID=1974726 RepID=A0A2H0TE53_9BACT|nr:MAG: putative lipid II flippase FtsW [Candidatus Niyogibacteria bacterium CG10_big_fil_rev_8_21_14_0_10_46_36]
MKTYSWDKPLFFISLALLVIGVFVFASAAIGLIGGNAESPISLFFRQILLGVGAGSILFLVSLFIPFTFWQKTSAVFLALAFVLLALVFVPGIGIIAGGAARWIDVGPISLQPAEPFKFAFMMYLAAWLTSHKKDIPTFRSGLIPFLIMAGIVSVFFVLQPDVGTLFVILGAATLLFFVGGGRLKHIALMGGLGALLLAALVAAEPYRLERIQVFLNPQEDLDDSGYQLHQALIAMGSGDIFGRGFGQSVQKFHYLPEPVGDAVFAVVGEEFGFIGSVSLIVLFLLFLWRSVYILARVPDQFARLFGAGIVIMIVFQSFINIAAIIGIVPMTGIPLVFISQGGSSLAITLAGIGILLHISKYARA